ncbi:MFS transporter [Chromobacterium phragmitis]|uniref:MFS transporter n=1 Tax=Chromobacterium phragmitis TaxID=2202141 RepID=A0A344UCR9_9NEIS|nr:MFS transporter [Chromobacterium phragmitis]AXE33067.1 MFS transporter [Chromobacterium phragmitis]
MSKASAQTAAVPREAARPAARVMVLCCLIVFMAQMATTVYLPSLPAVMRELAMSQSMVEMSISGFVVGAALPVLFWGSAADRWGRRGPLLVSLALFVLCSALLAAVGSAAELLALRVLQGIAAGGAAIIARIIVRDNWSGDELARRLSVLSIAFITALGGGQFIGGLIGEYSRWQLGFVLMAATGSFAALLSMSLPLQGGRPPAARRGGSPYWQILRRPGFVLPACAGGLGFATTVTLQEVSPFVFQEHFGLAVASFGNIGLLIGLAYFCGAMTVNRTVAKLGGKTLMRAGALLMAAATVAMLLCWHLGALEAGAGLLLFVGLYCLTIFGQAVLFPNSMATAVSDAKDHGAHAMALCGFLQQGLAGIAATASVLLHHNGAWTLAVAALGLITLMQVLFQARLRAA